MTDNTREKNQALIQEVLEVYPEKAQKERKKHLMTSDPALEKVGKCMACSCIAKPMKNPSIATPAYPKVNKLTQIF